MYMLLLLLLLIAFHTSANSWRLRQALCFWVVHLSISICPQCDIRQAESHGDSSLAVVMSYASNLQP